MSISLKKMTLNKVHPRDCCLFVGPGLKDFKLNLFMRIGLKIQDQGGSMIHGDFEKVRRLPDEIIPIVGCSPELRQDINGWQKRGRQFIYWDRGYARRIFATWLPRGADGGYYRWHLNNYQMQDVLDVPSDRWESLLPGNRVDPRRTDVMPWSRGEHVVIAAPSPTYEKFHEIVGWTDRTKKYLAENYPRRRVVVRDKEDKRSLADDLYDAHCLVTHGSNAAVEAAIMGCPVFVDETSAAKMVGRTDLDIENPVYPDRDRWLWSLAYSQFNEKELVDGTLWRYIQ